MTRYMAIFLLGWISICALPLETHALSKSAKVTLVVVDEEGRPLEGVDAGVGFEKNTGWGTDATAQRGLTDYEGRFTAAGSCNGHIGYGARMEGYYRSHYDYDFRDTGLFGWKPWNPELKIVMRKIGNPVPMYARNTKLSRVEIPDVGKEFGFDLILFDWVSPYGKGRYSDFIFRVDRYFDDVKNFEEKLTVSFANSHDGIQIYKESFYNGSKFKLPRFAPENGYRQLLITKSGQKNGRYYENFDLDENYIFRVRSVIDNGKVKKAIYGKIHGPFVVTGIMKKKPKIIMKYYLNPDYSRNLEFDPNRNLFGNLPPLERVGIQ